LISAAAVADVELTISPDAADKAATASPPSEATIPDVGNSPSSLISAAAVADVELTISPDAADKAATASGSKVSLSFYFHLILHMSSYYI
jgi:hypothetical protein